jgi:hypothetical protein
MPPKKKEVIYYNLGYNPKILKSMNDLDLIYLTSHMKYENPTVLFDKTGYGELRNDNKFVFRKRASSQPVMVVAIRNFLLSQLTIEEYDELALANTDTLKSSRYNGMFKRI